MELEDLIFNSLLKYTKALSVALRYRDFLTQLHSERVQGLSAEIGKCCGLSHQEMNTLIITASFHDIGKIGIPDQILLKPSKFDEVEWEIMKQHSEIGQKIMQSTELDGSQQVALLIRHHHEYYNGIEVIQINSPAKIFRFARELSVSLTATTRWLSQGHTITLGRTRKSWLYYKEKPGKNMTPS